MSKLIADDRHPEWDEAMIALVREIDIPDRLYMTIQDLIGPGLGRVFVREWLMQDTIDREIMYNPFDVAAGDPDPRWYQIDGIPSQDDSPEDVARRKWQRRAQIWFELYAPHVWHIVDWLIDARQTDQNWLRALDPRGEPKKLLKCTTLGDLAREATKCLRHRRTGGEIILGPGDEVFVADLGVGHALVALITPKALRKEGRRMHHCVGRGVYDGHLEDPALRLFSVRAPDGQPLATLELANDTVRQFRGLCNANPTPAVADLVSAVADAFGWQGLAEAAAGRYLPYGRDALRVLEGLEPVRRRI